MTTKTEIKIFKNRIRNKIEEIDVETKALQRAIDNRMGDTERLHEKHGDLKKLVNEFGKENHGTDKKRNNRNLHL